MTSNKFDFFLNLSKDANIDLLALEFAKYLDDNDKLRLFREKFSIPKFNNNKEVIYMNGNSLGLMPKDVKQALMVQLNKWENRGSLGHMEEPMPWMSCDEEMLEEIAEIVGSNINEISVMSQLTVNLHLMLVAFYKPKNQRYKILCENKPFPSDIYAFESQVEWHGYEPNNAIIKISPRENEHRIRTEDIINLIKKDGHEIALICLSGVQHYSGQLFKIKEITEVGHEMGCIVGWDLAHAVGNVPLDLHNWNVDFAVWCSYKYLNCGAGGIAGVFVHEKNHNDSIKYFRGWWGHRSSDRFQMTNDFKGERGALKYRLSNPSFTCCAILKTSLKIFKEVGMLNIRAKSILLTSYFEYLMKQKLNKHLFEIITPEEISERGSQLSIKVSLKLETISDYFKKMGIVCDYREPSTIRMAPCALYNSFVDVFNVVDALTKVYQLDIV